MGDWSSGGVRLVVLDQVGAMLEPKKTLNMNGVLSERLTDLVEQERLCGHYVPGQWHV
jgi:hypothetical protein